MYKLIIWLPCSFRGEEEGGQGEGHHRHPLNHQQAEEEGDREEEERRW